MEEPLISVVIPLYNREHLIKETIQSLIGQTYSNWECIIVDDKSDDNSYASAKVFVDKDNRIKVFRNQTDFKGPSICRQIGFNMSVGEFIIYLDSDDLLVPWALENRVKLLSSNSELDLLLSNGILYDFINDAFCGLTTMFGVQDILKEYYQFNVVFQTTAPTWRRAFLEENKIEWDKEIVYWDDVDYAMQAFYKNPTFLWGEKEPDYLMRNDEGHNSLRDRDDFLNKLLSNFKTFDKWKLKFPNEISFDRNFRKYMINKMEFNLSRTQLFKLLKDNGVLIKSYFGIRGYFYLFLLALTKNGRFLRGITYRARKLFISEDCSQFQSVVPFTISDISLDKLKSYILELKN